MIQLSLFDTEPDYQYSIAICPDEITTSEVGRMKTLLAQKIGYYSSRNAKAHISLFNTKMNMGVLEKFEIALDLFCKTQTPFEIHLDHTDIFQNGTFYLGLDKYSEFCVRKMKNNLCKAFSLKNGTPYRPHMSIARKGLTEDQLKIAGRIIKDIDLRFICDGICIRRKLKKDKGQYEIYSKALFG